MTPDYTFTKPSTVETRALWVIMPLCVSWKIYFKNVSACTSCSYEWFNPVSALINSQTTWWIIWNRSWDRYSLSITKIFIYGFLYHFLQTIDMSYLFFYEYSIRQNRVFLLKIIKYISSPNICNLSMILFTYFRSQPLIWGFTKLHTILQIGRQFSSSFLANKLSLDC